ncbi:MAG: winged helix-turn-helix transcriptional regulator [Candidatus Hodarchaeota archaeon]
MQKARMNSEEAMEGDQVSEKKMGENIIPSSSMPIQYKMVLSPLKQEIMDVAKELMNKHYLLDTHALFFQCLKSIRDHERAEIARSIDILLKKKILFEGKALTRNDIFKNRNRLEVFNIIKENPGIHLNRITKLMDKSPNLVSWHLKILEEFNFIRKEFMGNKVVFFEFLLDKRLDEMHYILNQNFVPNILYKVLSNPGLSFVDLLEDVDIPRSTLIRKVKVLIEHSIMNAGDSAGRIVGLNVNPKIREFIEEFIERKLGLKIPRGRRLKQRG